MQPTVRGVFVRTLGCKVNRSESETLAEELQAQGVRLCADEAEADLVVVNTCTVTGEADAKARKAVRHALALPGKPLVVVSGCLAALDAAGLRQLGDHVVVEPDKAELASCVRRLVAKDRPGSPPGSLRAGEPRARVVRTALSEHSGLSRRDRNGVFRTRVDVKVQDGCDHFCAYCVVPRARGNPHSVPASSVVERVRNLSGSGTAEVVLTGINIGRYADGGTDLAELLGLIAATGIPRIRISSIEPLDLTDHLLSVFANTPSVMPHLHVPLQSGCDRTLEMMRRGYDTRAYAETLQRARAEIPGLAVTTDVIAGFPGETDEDFRASLDFAERCAFARLHVFRYSSRPDTPAASMPGHVDRAEIAARAAAMRVLGDRLAVRRALERVGTRARVLVESVRDQVAEGTSEDYLRVSVRAGSRTVPGPGSVVLAELVGADGPAVRGEAVG